jgi:hypothetical protein
MGQEPARQKNRGCNARETGPFEITDCAQWTTLGLSLLPNCPRLSHISLRGLLPRRLLEPGAITRRVGRKAHGILAQKSGLDRRRHPRANPGQP